MSRMSLEEYHAHLEKRKPKELKYRNKKKVVNGLEFDSTKEARRYQDLLAWQHSGQITQLLRQQSFDIVVNGELICSYVADFTYRLEGQLVVEDVKSKVTRKLDLYRIKKKLMKAVLGIEIREA